MSYKELLKSFYPNVMDKKMAEFRIKYAALVNTDFVKRLRFQIK